MEKSASKKVQAKTHRSTKKAPVKKAAAKKAAAVTSSAVALARESLAESATSVQNAAIAALAHISPGLVEVTAAGIKPFGLLDRTFNDPLVGLDDSQMPAFYAAVSTAINDTRVDALIQAKLASSPSAAATIIDVINLIQFWVDHPDVKA
jgi:hypothetical protein